MRIPRMTGVRGWVWMTAALAALAFTVLAVHAKQGSLPSPRDQHPYLELRVPRVREPIAINAETEAAVVASTWACCQSFRAAPSA